jgi:hypothetical protein
MAAAGGRCTAVGGAQAARLGAPARGKVACVLDDTPAKDQT